MLHTNSDAKISLEVLSLYFYFIKFIFEKVGSHTQIVTKKLITEQSVSFLNLNLIKILKIKNLLPLPYSVHLECSVATCG